MNASSDRLVPRVVIVGGGAGGLELAVLLGRRLGKRKRAEVVLVDSTRSHLWKPLLHQVAAGTLDTRADEMEYLALSRKNGFLFRLGKMDGLDRDNKEIHIAPTLDEDGEELLPSHAIRYDYLVMALGSQTNDFNTPGARDYAIMLDSPSSASLFNRRFTDACLRAQARAKGPGEGRFTVTIIGGGATGVELSAELHMAASIITSYGLANFDPNRDLKIVIVDAAPRLLSVLPDRLSNAVMEELRELDVEVHTNERVIEVQKNAITMASGRIIPSDLIVWAAGIKAPDFLKDLDGLETNRINQLVTLRNMQTTRDPAIFALGDCGSCPQDEGKPTVPPRAQAAHQQAEMLAKSIERLLDGKSPLDYTYRDYGSLVSLGDYSTVGSLMGSISRGSLFIEGHIAKWMYWWLRKQHQMQINGLFHTWLSTWADFINRVKNPRIKLH